MNRTVTALSVTALAAATAVGGVAIAGAQDGPAGSSAVEVAPAAAPAAPAGRAAATRQARTGDDGLTYAQATKARSAALKRVAGRAVQIERDADDGRVTYDVEVIGRNGQAREVRLDRSFRVTRTVRTDTDGLTHSTAGKAASAATKRVRGLVTGIDVDDDDGARYEVEVLTRSAGERTVRLSSSFGVVTGTTDDDGDDD
jgi:uncharacterized membrane protein YkoI